MDALVAFGKLIGMIVLGAVLVAGITLGIVLLTYNPKG
jgi:hypothetical protein